VDQSDSTPTSESKFNNGICTFSSAAFIRIFYENIGTAAEAQKVVLMSDFQVNQDHPWTFTKPDKSMKQRFQMMMSVQYYPVDQ